MSAQAGQLHSLVCGDRRGRTHRVRVSEKAPPFDIDVDFESVIHSQPFLFMRAEEDVSTEQLDVHARRLGEVLGTTTVVLVRQQHEATILRRVPTAGSGQEVRLSLPSRKGEPWPATDLALAIQTLRAEAEPPPAEAAPAARGETRSAESKPYELALFSSRERSRARTSGITLMSIGSASALAAAGLHVWARNKRADADEDAAEPSGYLDTQAGRAGFASITGAVLGEVGLGVGLAQLLAVGLDEGRSNVALGVSSAAVGAALVGLGVWRLSSAPEDNRLDRHNENELGVLLLAPGAGLLTASAFMAAAFYLPLSLQQDRNDPKAAVSVQSSDRSLSIRGAF